MIFTFHSSHFTLHSSTASRYVVFDVETTGLSAARGHRIIEIGAVEVNGAEVGEEFQSLIRTDRPITKGARKVHGIAPEMLAGHPEAKEVVARFRDFVGTSMLVAHHAPFDVGFIQWECMRAGIVLNCRYRCTLRMSRRAFPFLRNYRLETVARHLGIAVDEGRRHRALGDARLTAQVWIEMRKVR
jgi:DNA polymerase III epsilon subunit